VTADTVQTLGTAVSVLAVALSIVGLAIGIRHNTRAQNSQNYAHALGRLAALQSRLGADDDTTDMFVRGVRNAADLTSIERVRFTWTLYEMFGLFEFMYHQAQAKTLPKDQWERWAIGTSWWLSYPGIRAWWKARPTPFSREFSSSRSAWLGRSTARTRASVGATSLPMVVKWWPPRRTSRSASPPQTQSAPGYSVAATASGVST
jgi:hypothetical protein